MKTLNLDRNPYTANWAKQVWDNPDVTNEAELDAWCEKLGTTTARYLRSASGRVLLDGGEAPGWIVAIADRMGIKHA